MITKFEDLDLSKKYTYADYLTWQFQERVELLRGRIFKMSPSPNTKHQRISREIFLEIGFFLRKKSCEVFSAPFDVRLPLPPKKIKKGKTDTVVQPDITIVCDKSKLDKQGCNGAPDLVVEILSPGNTKKEMKNKLEVYQYAEIPEYWVVHPTEEYVIVYTLNDKKKYIGSTPYTDEDIVKSKVLKGFELNLSDVFEL